VIRIDSIASLAALPFDEVIDVRSPSEYAEDHLPGAISLPVLSDAERAEVGTLYKQVAPFEARKRGAALVARNAAAHLQGPLADRPYRWRPLVCCWRGGQRSQSFASILTQIGWRAETVEGGYQSWRRLVVAMLYDRPLPHPLVLIDGHTGTAKTRLLALLAEAGAQVVDLEGLANHRGSILGAQGPQPSQKQFETRLAVAFEALDPARPVFVEAEAAKVGDLLVPKAVLAAMRRAPHVEIVAPLAARADHLMQSYADMVAEPGILAGRLAKLRPFHAGEVLDSWLEMARLGHFHALASDLMQRHYDPRYARAATRRAGAGHAVRLAALDDDSLREAIAGIVAFGDRATSLGPDEDGSRGASGGSI
jgi:tRNA 2-selenouridine synthase